MFLYGMRMFAMLAGLLVSGGVLIAAYGASSFNVGAWYTGVTLLVFAGIGRAGVGHELARRRNHDRVIAAPTA